MPELAEVHVMVEALNERVSSLIAKGMDTVSGSFTHQNFLKRGLDLGVLSGQKLVAPFCTRKAKYILLHFSEGILLCHNKFTGYWDTKEEPWSFDYLEFKRELDAIERDVRCGIWVTNPSYQGSDCLRFHDARCLGLLKWYPKEVAPTDFHELKNMGPDVIQTTTTDPAFGERWDWQEFDSKLSQSKQAIKLYLLDQKNQAGVGNIYACEALYRVGVHPSIPSKNLTQAQRISLYEWIIRLLGEAIAQKVKYDGYIRVFRKEQCPLGHGIARIVQSNRGTYLCPTCQPMAMVGFEFMRD